MKTEIFKTAIKNRNRLKFLYGLDEFLSEPYYIMTDKNGNKVIYGKISGSSEIRKFAYNKIANIKVLEKRKFSPIIPIIPMAS